MLGIQYLYISSFRLITRFQLDSVMMFYTTLLPGKLNFDIYSEVTAHCTWYTNWISCKF